MVHQLRAGFLMDGHEMQECTNARMQKCRRWAVCALVHLCILASAVAARAEVVDRVLAVVSGDLITLSDVTAARDLGLVTPGDAVDPVRAVLAQLIDRELQLAEVERYAPTEPTVDDVDREVQAVRARFVSQPAFDAVLARSGIDLQHLRQTLRENLRIRAYLDQRFATADERRQ